MNSQEKAAYLAGVMDCDGSYGIVFGKRARQGCPDQYVARLVVTNTNHALLSWIKDIWGGSVYISKKSPKPNWKLLGMWRVSNRAALGVLKQVLPYVQAKKEQVAVVLALQGTKGEGKKRTDSMVQYQARLKAYMHKLNHKGVPIAAEEG